MGTGRMMAITALRIDDGTEIEYASSVRDTTDYLVAAAETGGWLKFPSPDGEWHYLDPQRVDSVHARPRRWVDPGMNPLPPSDLKPHPPRPQ